MSRSDRDELLAVLSHELQGTLSTVIGFGELLAESDRLGEREHDWVEQIGRGAHRQSRLIRDLVFLARIESGGFSANPGPLDLAALAGEAVAALAGPAAEAGVELRLSSADPAEVGGDRPRLEQALVGLVGGAIALSSEGSGVEVAVRAEGGGAGVELSGAAISVPPAARPHLFDNPIVDEGGGAGLRPAAAVGLRVAGAVIAAHGGLAAVEAGAGGGAALTARLPSEPPAPVTYPVPASRPGE